MPVLVEGIDLEVTHKTPVTAEAQVWRIIVSFISQRPKKNKMIKEYYIWVTGEYLKTKAKQPNITAAEEFALELAKKRFEESGNQVPIENGISCSIDEGMIYVNPKIFVPSAEK